MKYWYAVMTEVTLVIAALIIVFAVPAFAHAELDHCTPAIGSRVAAAPNQVVCVTTDELDTKLSTIAVFDANKIRADKGDGRVDLNDADRKTLIVSLDPSKLKDGVYTVTWHAVTVDDRAISDGTFQFIVGNVAATPAPTTLIVQETDADATPTLTTAVAAASATPIEPSPPPSVRAGASVTSTTAAPAAPVPQATATTAARTTPIEPSPPPQTGLERFGPWLFVVSIGTVIVLIGVAWRLRGKK